MNACRFRLLFLAMVCGGLVGCATEQWKATEAQCLMDALQIFPVATEQRMVLDMPPMPLINRCTQVSYKDQNGKDHVRNNCTLFPMMPFPRWETVDLNQRSRQAHVRSCTQNSCIQNYGNTDCKWPPPEVTLKP